MRSDSEYLCKRYPILLIKLFRNVEIKNFHSKLARNIL